MTYESDLTGRWALILGASSGFGRATSLELARRGMNVFGVHLDLKATLPLAKQTIAEIEAMGRQAVFFNTNAADGQKRSAPGCWTRSRKRWRPAEVRRPCTC